MTSELHANDASIIDVVMNRTHGRHNRAFIAELVDTQVQQFDGASFKNFVRVLVIKEALDELRTLDARRPVAS